MRAAGCFGAAMITVEGKRYSKVPTDTMHAVKRVPLLNNEDLLANIPYDCVPIAIEITEDATPLQEFTHPPRGFYIFGPEDGSLPKRITDRCAHVLKIPSGCLNLAAAVNVVLYDRVAKETR